MYGASPAHGGGGGGSHLGKGDTILWDDRTSSKRLLLDYILPQVGQAVLEHVRGVKGCLDADLQQFLAPLQSLACMQMKVSTAA